MCRVKGWSLFCKLYKGGGQYEGMNVVLGIGVALCGEIESWEGGIAYKLDFVVRLEE
jgi:hypothetical protein